MRINYQSDVIFTTFIRVFGLVLKFIMMLSMGKYALESEVGRFAIIVTLVAYSSQVLGLEFHYYSIRQIQKGKFDQLVMIRDQVVFHIATYILLLPVLYLVLYKFIGVVFIGILMAIIFFEQISQEMFRVVSALQHPVKATILLFIRTAPWMIFTVYVLYGESDKGFLVEIMPYWLLSAFTSVILSIYFLKKEVGKFIFFQKINICWIIEGIKSSIPFIMASVSFGLFSVLDKIVLNQIIGEELLGVYYILLSLAVGHYTIVTFSVGIYYGPRVLDAFYNKTEIEFSSIRNKGVRSIIKTSLLLIFPASIGIHIALFFIGKEVYYEYIWIYYLGLVVNMLWILSDIINYDLFIHNQDKTIAWISISSVIILLILLLILTPVLSVYGALLSSAITFMYLIYIRYKYATRSIDDYKILDI